MLRGDAEGWSRVGVRLGAGGQTSSRMYVGSFSFPLCLLRPFFLDSPAVYTLFVYDVGQIARLARARAATIANEMGRGTRFGMRRAIPTSTKDERSIRLVSSSTTAVIADFVNGDFLCCCCSFFFFFYVRYGIRMASDSVSTRWKLPIHN